jgi:alkaline phosphatase D
MTNQPKRHGQPAMIEILEGRYKEAAQYCRSLLEADPNDLEALFNLSLAQGLIGDQSEALNSMRKAIEGGLPFGRYLVGPRKLIKPLAETSQFKEYAFKYDSQLLHGPMIGCVTDRSAKFWVRTLNEVGFQVLVSESKNFARPAQSTVVTTSRVNDYTAVVEVRGLKPATQYYYNVVLAGKSAFGSDYPSFTTYFERGSKSAFEVGFGGGAGYTPVHERMWDTIASPTPSAFLFLGDNVYIDLPQQYGDFHRYTYYRRQSVPQYRKLVGSCSIYAIWDDHDCATNDAWMGPYRDKPSWKMSMLEGFKQNWNNPEYGDDEWPGCWFSFSIADVDFFMLDGRFYRTNPYASEPTMLGPVQKRWLFKQLQQSRGTFKVIASPVCWTFNSKGKSLDTWNGFRDERDEIFDFLKNNKIEGVILISADRHRSDAWRIERPGAYSLYEFSSSRLTNVHSHKLMPEALFGYNEKQSFGLLRLNTNTEDPTVTYRIVSIDNEVIHTLTVKHSQLRH